MKKSVFSGKTARNLILLGLSIMAYDIIYLATVLYVPFQKAFDLTNTQIGSLLAINSGASIACHIVSGWLCDRFSPKKCLVISVLASSLTAFWMASMPDYGALKIIFVLLISVNFVWAPYIKCMRMLSAEIGSGRTFGTAAMIEAAVSGVLFFVPVVWMGGRIAVRENFSRLILIFACVVLAEGIALALFLDYDALAEKGGGLTSSAASIKNITLVAKMPETWILLLINTCYYGVMTEMTYISAYMNQVYLFPLAWTTVLIVADRFFVRSAAAYLGGSIRDRIGSVGKSMGIACVFTLICYMILLLMPEKPKYLPAVVFVSVVLFFSYYLNSNAANVAVTELAPPGHLTGTMIGFYSVCTCFVNMGLQTVSGRVLDAYPVWGFRIVTLISCSLLVLWIFAGKLLVKFQDKDFKGRSSKNKSVRN